MALRPKVERYGELRDFSLNMKEQQFTAEILLRGEREPFVISHARYRIEKKGGDSYLVVHEMKVSKKWVQNILNDHFQELRLTLPEFLRPFVH